MATIHYPQSIPDWSNLSVIHKNTLTPRATFYLYDNEENALSRDIQKSKSMSLSGTWKFKLTPYPIEPAQEFFAPDLDTSLWDDIKVPGMWQLQGHGKGPQYTNVNFPWPVDPPNISFDDNETGHYVRKFVVPKSFGEHQLRLRFEGVDSGFHVWVNGKPVGYSQGARNPSEWDITTFVYMNKENTLAVRVYQRCDGSYIEDQDQWWLSGIFRDVNLLAFPKIHICDFKVETIFDERYVDAMLVVHVELNAPAKVQLKLLESDMAVKDELISAAPESSKINFKLPIKRPRKWTAESPYLYTLLLEVISKDNCQVVSQRVGFRKVEIKDGLLRVNGDPIIIRGVNRHEHHPDHGRTVPLEFLRNDLLLMKTHNINGIRTSHQINDPRLYDLADELGFWVLDEADLECHGMEELGGDPASWTSDNPEWEEAYVDRARQLIMRDKNHPCIIIWSLGNEAFYGRNHQSMYDLIHSYDPTRPVHYEPDQDAQTVDMFSRMYSSVDYIIDFATKENKWKKPLILCEFVHAMGNGPGNIKEYVDAFYKYPRLQGGFVWEWANHGLRTRASTGEEYYGYGGDFGDVPNDGHFVMDGLLFSDHTPTPGLIEYKKAIEPIQVLLEESTPERILIINRYDCVTLDHLKCEWSVVGDGFTRPRKELVIPKGIQPGRTVILSIEDFELEKFPTRSYLEVSFTLKSSTLWAEKGFEVAWAQIPVNPENNLTSLKTIASEDLCCPVLNKISPSLFEITGSGGCVWQFDQVHGTLVSWKKGHNDDDLLLSAPTLSFYRAVTDNDRNQDGADWVNARLHQLESHSCSCTISTKKNSQAVTIIVKSRLAPPVFEWSIDATTTYVFQGSSVKINVCGSPRGLRLPRTFARIGLTFSLNSSITEASWFGRGPGESYRDKKLSQRFGNWKSPISALYTPYEFPQESGNRTDIRWVDLYSGSGRDKHGIKASFGDQEGGSFTAHHYETSDLDDCQHTYEIEKRRKQEVIVRLDWAHHGLGTGSCGPKTLPQYELLSQPFEFELLLE